MDAFHSFWSKPNSVRAGGGILLPEYELLTTILSALEWKKHNGSIRMVTDTAGAKFYEEIGLTSLWDEVDTSLDEISDKVDPVLFWAAGKLYALQKMKTPIVMLDTDLIVWKSLPDLSQYDIVTAHDEYLNPEVYPDPQGFQLKPGYEYPKEWNFQLRAANTAFLYLKDENFRDYYVKAATDFFENVRLEGLNPVTAMCFAEQRILPMAAEEKGKSMGYLLELEYADRQDFMTHTWGYKKILSEVPEANAEFCMRCRYRIAEEFPDFKLLF